MRILTICREAPPIGGGAGAVALALAEQLADRGHEVDYVTMHHGDMPRRESRGRLTIHRVRCGRRNADSAGFGSMLRFVVAAARHGRRLARSGPVALVHAHAIVPDGFAGRRAARAVGCPLVITAHGTDVPGYDQGRYSRVHRALAPAWRRLVADTDLITTNSQHLRSLISGAAPGSDPVVIPNGIDSALFDRPAVPRSGMLIMSRLIERKGYDRFLEALALVDRQQKVTVVGDGPERARLERLAGMSGHPVEFLGWLDRGSPAWRAAFEEHRFLVFPSRNENFPVNLLEAQAAGLTVLASDIASNREVLGDHAIYFPDLTVEAIATTIRNVLDRSEADLHALGERAARRVRTLFAWSAIADRYEQEFDAIAR